MTLRPVECICIIRNIDFTYDTTFRIHVNDDTTDDTVKTNVLKILKLNPGLYAVEITRDLLGRYIVSLEHWEVLDKRARDNDEIRTEEIRTAEIRTEEIRTAEICADEIRTAEICADEIRTVEIDSDSDDPQENPESKDELHETAETVNGNGVKQWRNAKGELHRADGPAYESVSGDKYWYQNNKIHREDGPAVEYVSGTKAWYQNGQRHRTDGPAIILTNGDKSWYQNGEIHRTNGPAMEYANGDKCWYQNNKIHRTDGPAIILSNGDKYWYQNGVLHRTDGPAIEYGGGAKVWYIDNKQFTETEFTKYIDSVNNRNNGVTMIVNDAGDKEWRNAKGELHRTDGPAIEQANGTKYWFQNGQRHRTDGPAIEYAGGAKHWYQNGKLHRTDGPAIEWASGDKAWYIEDKQLSETAFTEYIDSVNNRNNGVTMIVNDVGDKEWRNVKGELHRTDGPAYENANGGKSWYQNGKLHRTDGFAILSSGDKYWYQNGKLHRTDGPAIEFANGGKHWYQNNKLHRTDGPAYEFANGTKCWYIDGKQFTEAEFTEYIECVNNRNNGVVDQVTCTVNYVGTKEWRNINGDLHRTDGPAMECENGDKRWYQNGKLHREDGPAIEYPNGDKSWYQNGKLHRTDGPAIERASGDKCMWYIEGNALTEAEFTEYVIVNQVTMTVYANGDKYWGNIHKELHRTDGPAIEYANGDKYWYQNGKLHRIDGPAIESNNGEDGWYINGKEFTETEYREVVTCFCEIDKLDKPETR